ncbi:GNAT family N-acetyltransferase [bacterium]|nr:GNAT family N-acetyltransferase [bacterium]
MGEISNATKCDAGKLCEIAVSAFAEDEKHKPDHISKGGPPNHNSIQTHLDWIDGDVYLKYEESGQLCGGCVAKINGSHGEIIGIFVGASSMNKGIGSSLLRYLISEYSNVKTWVLETPDYSKRNHAFYEKHGFVCVNKSEPEDEIGFGFYQYQKKIDLDEHRISVSELEVLPVFRKFFDL